MPEMTVEEATVQKLLAERDAYASEAAYNRLQSERLVRVREEEDITASRQRILDFVTEVTESSAYRAINKLTEWREKSQEPITIRFNTPGGDFLSAMALFDYICALRGEGIDITTIAIGMAASAGSALLQAGTRRLVTPGAWVMIHEISSFSAGKLSEMMEETKWAERAQTRFFEILSERSKLTPLQIKRKCNKKDWWLNAEEAVKNGFADDILSTPKPVRVTSTVTSA